MHGLHHRLFTDEEEEEREAATAVAADEAIPLDLDEGGTSLALVRTEADPFAWGGPPVRWAARDQPGSVILEVNDGAEASELQKFQQGVELVARSLENARSVLRNVVLPTQMVSFPFCWILADSVFFLRLIDVLLSFSGGCPSQPGEIPVPSSRERDLG